MDASTHTHPTTAPAEHDDAGGHAHPKYFSIWFILLIVTLAEVLVAVSHLPKGWKTVTLIAMALYKAVMVALYFMHLKFERKTMMIIASAPLIFGVILAIGTFPDSEKGSSAFKRGELHPYVEKPK